MTSQDNAAAQPLGSSEAPRSQAVSAALSSPQWEQLESEKAATISDKASISEAAIPPNPRLQALVAKRANLESTLATLQSQKSALVSTAKLPSGLAMPFTWSEEEQTKAALANANGAIKEHIALLHKYNEIKDIGQGLMGLIADTRGVRVAVVMEEFGMDEKD